MLHTTPLPSNPLLHAHVNPPSVSVHVALAWQLFAPVAHSSMLVQDVPSPLYPDLQAQEKDPALLKQSALASQLLSDADAHSSSSVHVNPFPENPELHAQVYDPSVSVQVPYALHS